MAREEPQRSCIACREVKPKNELFRFVLSPDRMIVPDPQAKLPGRGAYICQSTECLKNAVSKKQFSRTYKVEIAGPSADVLLEQVKEILFERIASYLSLASKAGKVISGSDMVADTIRKRSSIGLVIVATDAADETTRKLTTITERAGVAMYSMFDKERLGILIGKDGFRSVVAVGESGFIMTIRKEIEKYRNFFEGGAQ